MTTRRITPDEVIRSYQQINAAPIRYDFGRRPYCNPDRWEWTNQCCGLGAVMQARGIDANLIFDEATLTTLGISETYRYGFTLGFDDFAAGGVGENWLEELNLKGKLLDFIYGVRDGYAAYDAVQFALNIGELDGSEEED